MLINRDKKEERPKEAQTVVGTSSSNVKCIKLLICFTLANYVEWKVGDRCEALYKEDNKYYPGRRIILFSNIAIIHKLDEFQIDVTVFYIGYNSSAVLDMSEIRKPTTRWDVADRLAEKDIRVFVFNRFNE